MTQVYEDQTWAVRALCADIDPDSLFVRGSAQADARQMCFSCPVRIECLADALDSNMSFGIWGGMTERERRALVRRFPNVTDWWEYLTQSDDPVAVELRAGASHAYPGALRHDKCHDSKKPTQHRAERCCLVQAERGRLPVTSELRLRLCTTRFSAPSDGCTYLNHCSLGTTAVVRYREP